MDKFFELSQKWIDHLVALPESGMGYQNVNVKFTDGSSVDCIALNSQHLDIPSSHHAKTISDIKLITK